ncbi:MAG: glucokinase [Paracoccaceae bacterium]
MGKHPSNVYSLVADVGGTNTRVALAEGTRLLEDTVRKYANVDYPGLETVLHRYIADEADVDCTGVCVAIAGPVQDGVGALTNLDWHIDFAALIRVTRAENVAILNDLQAQGHALGFIDPANIIPVIKGPVAAQNATMMVFGVGTGVNAATALHTKAGRLVPPSECGHANLPIRTEDELRFARYIEQVHGFPSIEDALSGPGLENLYRWAAHEAGQELRLSAAEIMARVNEGSDPVAEQAAAMFVKILGTVAGNLSLIHLPFGGMFLIGGVVRAMAPHFERFGFSEAFHDKGRLSEFMHGFSVSVIEDDFAALVGCASHLVDLG